MSGDIRPPFFFHDSNTSKPLINRLKYFRIRFRFCQDIRILKKLHGVQCASHRGVRRRGVHRPAESDSPLCIILRSHENKASEKTLQCASSRGNRLRGVHHTAESWKQSIWKNSAVCIPPRSRTHRCASYRGQCASYHRVSNLPSVFFYLKFYDCYISMMP